VDTTYGAGIDAWKSKISKHHPSILWSHIELLCSPPAIPGQYEQYLTQQNNAWKTRRTQYESLAEKTAPEQATEGASSSAQKKQPGVYASSALHASGGAGSSEVNGSTK
jgi:hypothetical protein